MKIECVREKLLEGLNKVDKITGKNLSLPVLSNILLEVKNNNLTLKSTNLDLGAEIQIPIKKTEEGVVAIPGSVLASFLNQAVSDRNIILEKDKNTLLVKTSKAVARIKTTPHEDFPIIPRMTEVPPLRIDSKTFLDGLRSVYWSASPQSIKPELASVFVSNVNGELVFAATDSFRLAEKRIKAKNRDEIESVLIPFKNIVEIIRVLETAPEAIDFRVDQNQMSLSFEGTYLLSRIVDGTFPDYNQIIPKDRKTEVVILKEDLVNALKTTHIFSNNFNEVRFEIDPGKKEFVIKTHNAELGESIQRLETALKGEKIEINFNYRYITDCFQAINTDSVVLSFSGLGKPLIIQGVNNKTFLYIVMPMNR